MLNDGTSDKLSKKKLRLLFLFLRDSDLRELLAVVLFSRFLVAFIAIASDSVIPKGLVNVPFLSNFWFPYVVPLELFAKWDSFYYLHIAIEGYVKYELLAFRPLYPLLMRIILNIVGYSNWAIGGLAWNTFALTLAAIYLYRLTNLLLDQESARYTVLFLSVVPAAVFFTAMYPESTYLLLITASFYYLEKNQISRAILLSVLAGFTRPEGFLTFIPFIWKAFILKEKRSKLLVGSAMILFTLPAFMFYSYAVTGDPYMPFEIESKWGKTRFQDLVNRVLSDQSISASSQAIYSISTIVLVNVILSLIVYILDLRSRGLLSITLRPIYDGRMPLRPIYDGRITLRPIYDGRMPYYLFTFILVCTFLLVGEYASFPRFTACLFPILWSNAIWIKKRSIRVYLLLSLYVSLMTIGTSFFINWYFFV